eukprot:CAMPEP_0174832148 /NCGR_PEP_ID=MMETSP1114-20130205/3518_1 /TAXON_ID=312471 /ORGANISM="Neobodo designis, Strain CCAP 1951/1" /LENGTH=330 /DNA_ID=CAMNT_0016066003 /DNA_START=30 /DNA_END=1022 /DNA_ORIENTATION=+
MSQTLSIPERTIEARNFLKFRCRLDSEIGADVHRSFTGVYYPRWRSIYLDEVREVGRQIKLFPVFDLQVMLKPDEDYYMPEDFSVGARLLFGKSEFSRDGAAKTFVVTSVDDSNLHGWEVAKGASSTGAGVSRGAASAAETEAMSKIKSALLMRSGSAPQAIKDLGKYFRQPNASGQRLITDESFAAMCKDLQVKLSAAEARDLLSRYDVDGDGNVSYDEFVSTLRGGMSDARKQLIADTFAKIDTDRDGVVTPGELAAAFAATRHPDVASGNVSEAQVRNGFMASWDTREKNGQIPFPEFSDYYSGISAVIEDDRDFAAAVRATWTVWQ